MPLLLAAELFIQPQPHFMFFPVAFRFFPGRLFRIGLGFLPLLLFPLLLFPLRLFPALPGSFPGPGFQFLPGRQLMLMQELGPPDQIQRNGKGQQQKRPQYPEIFVLHADTVAVQVNHPGHQTAEHQNNHVGQTVRHPP